MESDKSEQELVEQAREDAALDALIVLCLLDDPDDDDWDALPDDVIPELSQADREALDTIDINAIIERCNGKSTV